MRTHIVAPPYQRGILFPLRDDSFTKVTVFSGQLINEKMLKDFFTIYSCVKT